MPGTLLHPLRDAPRTGSRRDLDSPTRSFSNGWRWATRWSALLAVVVYFAVCHGCHGNEDNELIIALWKDPGTRQGEAPVRALTGREE